MKVEVVVLDSPSLTVRMVSVVVKQHSRNEELFVRSVLLYVHRDLKATVEITH